MRVDVRRLAAAERSDLADFLETLTPDQWEAPTLCEGWSVHDVVAHVISYDELDLGDLAAHILRGGLDSRRINASTMSRLSCGEPAELIEKLRTHLEPRGLMSFAGGRVALLEAVVHHQDIRRALDRPRSVPPERLVTALRSALMAPDVGSFWRVRGFRLVASDVDFTWGFGPEVRGRGEALLMTIAGRAGVVEELDGPGRLELRARLVGSATARSARRAGLTSALTPERAARVYDRIGGLQDTQRLYEAPAVDDLIAHADLAGARSVYELGCGTGALAARLLGDVLPATATYQGVDVSSKMVGLTSRRLEQFGERARVVKVDGRPPLPGATAGFDRFLALYVLDLLDESSARALLAEARRLLAPGGLLCLASLTHGTTLPSRALCRGWETVFRHAPALVGGCRPVDLVSLLDGWRIEHNHTVVTWAVPTQVVVARRQDPAARGGPPG